MSRSLDILTVGIVTKPFDFEGRKRKMVADEGVNDLKEHVDTLIVIPNQRLLSVVNRQTSLTEAFSVADDVLLHATKGIADLISTPGLINLDFADVKTVMSEMGDALMGTGIGEGETRAIDAAQAAISSPLLEEISVSGARGVLVNITGGEDLCLFEVNDATSVIYEAAGEDANIIFGAVIDPRLNDQTRVTVIATGLGHGSDKAEKEEAEAIEAVTSFDHEDLDIPTFKRREREEPQVEKVPQIQARSYARDDLDVPTFLRKQMD
jgi:cell division protein FtsZ